jgi:tetratricopeptide (TPR) repeat protein
MAAACRTRARPRRAALSFFRAHCRVQLRMKRLLPLLLLAFAAVAHADDAPISLSDADGQELILEELSVRTAIHGMLSLTELELRFRNPKPRRIEGRFSCTLPRNAAISRFAKEVNGNLMEGEVVERLRANQVYEQFLHQMRDPALLEQDQGNRFSARIFPIEANAPVRIVLSYSALLPLHNGIRTYTLPLRGTAKVNKFTFRAFVMPLAGEEQTSSSSSKFSGPSGAQHSTTDVISIDERDYVAQHDIELSWKPTADAARARVVTAGDFYLAAFRPQLAAAQAAAPHSWLFYIDTSASSAEGSAHRITALQTILEALPDSDEVELIAFDQELAPLATGTASELAPRISALLRTRLFLGGSDIEKLLRDAGTRARQQPDRGIVIASDLVATLGKTEPKELLDAIKALPQRALVHALILGPREDSQVAKALTAGRGRVIDVPFSDQLKVRAREAAQSLRRPLGASFDVSDTNAEWVYPNHVDDVASGDEVIILGKRNASAEPAVHLISSGNRSIAAESSMRLTASTFAPLLEREAYRAYLEYLAEREANEVSEAVRSALANEQVKISTEQRVVIPRTTMLVLESEWDYQRFGLNRRALAAILTIDAGGIARLDRPAFVPVPVAVTKSAPPPSRPEARDDRISESVTVTGSAPAVLASPEVDFVRTETSAEYGRVTGGAPSGVVAQRIIASPVPPPERPREETKSDISWTKVHKPTDDEIASLQKKLKDDPRDRATYNALGEALAARGEWRALRELALRWQPWDAENPQLYELLGLANEHLDLDSEGARAIASLIEVAAAKPELLQRAGVLLLRLNHARIAETPLRRALALRPDRVNSYRHLALMLWQQGRYEEAARVLEQATKQTFPNWYRDAQRIVREELGYVYRGWIVKEPARRNEIADRARDFNVSLARRDALRVSIAWETDANDVDLHVVDPKGEECFYSHPHTATGLELYEDITQGLGPEVVRTERAAAGTYHVGVNYFAAGPMGVSRGIVVVLRDRGDDREPGVEIFPFRLAEGGRGDIRYITAIAMK